jgi:hypothetical protein
LNECIVKPWAISVGSEFRDIRYVAKSRGQALAKAWRDYQILGPTSFRDFLKIARARRASVEGFGEPIRIAGTAGFRVGERGQYIAFVRPNSDEILLSHPADVKSETSETTV